MNNVLSFFSDIFVIISIDFILTTAITEKSIEWGTKSLLIIVVGIVVSNGASSIRASSRSDLKVGEVVVIGVDNFHHWVLAVAIYWV